MSSSLDKTIQELSDGALESQELQEAVNCLIEFYELLIGMDLEQKQKRESEAE